MDFEVQRCTRRCAASDRELRPGESFYSVLLPDGGSVKRVDYAIDSWQGAPENSIGHWRSRMPDPNTQKVTWAPNDVILHYFAGLGEDPDVADTRFVLALLMVRRRILRLEESESVDGKDVMVLYCGKNETEYRVTVTDPTAAKVTAIEDELAGLLFGNDEGAEETESNEDQ